MFSESLPRLKAPAEHGAILAFPPLDDAGALLAASADRLASWSIDVAGQPLADLRRLARHQTVETARRYLDEAGESVPAWTGGRLILAGHQPELFHPGVWFKNFALQALARRHDAVPLNLVIDNDTAKSTSLRVPHEARVANIPFDLRQDQAPLEERTVQDEALFASLPGRVEPYVTDWPFRPMLRAYWSEASRVARRTPLLGERLASARRQVERAWGWRPLETPLSRVCGTEAFRCFVVHVLRELPRFHADYNAAVRAYRRRHGLRGALHPVPDLARDGDWFEAPFWAWRAGDARRQRLWALVDGAALRLRAGAAAWPGLSGAVAAQINSLRDLEAAGGKIRTRALTTTLFSRLLLGDLFLHGIGGGKYDEVTDDLSRRFFGGAPADYLVLTATLLLPLERFPTAAAEHRRLRRELRDAWWNPQRHLDAGGASAARSLLDAKEEWTARTGAAADERRRRFAKLRELTEALRPFAAGQATELRRRCADAAALRALHQARSSREYSFCLFPEEMLRDFLQRLL